MSANTTAAERSGARESDGHPGAGGRAAATAGSRDSAAAGGQPTLLTVLVWFALIAADLELAILGYRKFVRDEVIGMGWQTVWLTPVADVLIFLLASVPVLLAARLRPRMFGRRVVIGWLGFLVALCTLLMFERLHTYAVVLLATGVGIQAARWTSSRSAAFARLVRRTAAPLALGFVALTLGSAGFRQLREWRAMRMLPAAAPAGAPNVLLLILDTVRAASLSLYGHTAPTSPELAKLADGGVVFDWAISTAPWTLPSHASMFTGLYPHEVKAGWGTPLETGVPTLAEALSSNGYRTAGFVANLEYGTYERGLARGFQRYDDFEAGWGQLVLSSSLGRYLNAKNALRRAIGYNQILNRKHASDVAGDFLSWQASGDSRPFFAFLNFFDAHLPYLPPEPFATQFGHGSQWRSNQFMPNAMWWLNTDDMPETTLRAEQKAYEGAIASLDHEIGVMMAELDRRGALDNTIVIITSDHGEEFKEHGVVTHAHSIYAPGLHVPLMVIAPKRAPAGIRVQHPVSLRDLPATVMDLASLRRSRFPGHSLARFWRFEGAVPDEVIPATAPAHALSQLKLLESFSGPKSAETRLAKKSFAQSVVLWPYHFIRYRDGTEEMYDLASDPWEKVDLTKGSLGKETVDRLRSMLPPMPAKQTKTE